MNKEDLMPKFYTLEDMTQEDLNKLALERNTFAKEISCLNNIIYGLEEFIKFQRKISLELNNSYCVSLCDRFEDQLKELKKVNNEN